MSLLVLGLLIFLGVHSISIVAPQWRNAQVARHGEKTWKGIYAVASLIGFVLLIIGYGMARQSPIVLYSPPAGLRHFALLLMLPVFPLLLAAYLPGRIRSAARHPMLLAVKFWALAHLLANGMASDVLLFGGFLAWAVLDRTSVKRRGVKDGSNDGKTGSIRNDLIAVFAGLALYLLFVWKLHVWLIGVSPIGGM